MKSCRIVLFCGSLAFGGAERVLSILANSLMDIYSDVTLLLYYNRKICYELSDHIKIVTVEEKTKTKNLFINALWIRDFMKVNADLIISFMSVFNMYITISTIGLEIQIIVANRSDPSKEPQKKFLRYVRNFLYRIPKAITVQTQSAKEYFPNNLHKKIFVIPNPISEDLVKGDALKCAKKKKIVSVGRLIKLKNQQMLIDVFSEHLNTFKDYELVFYGDGDLRHYLEDHVRNIGCQGKVIFAGNQKNLFVQIKDSEFFVLPSDYEGMPNALVEAMCLGLPVISTKVSGANDFIIDGINGTLIECGDKAALANAMTEIAINEEKRLAYSHEAVKIYDQLQKDNIVKKWLEVIESL